MKPKYFATIASNYGEIMIGSQNPIIDLPVIVETARDIVGDDLFKIAEYLKDNYGWRRVQAAHYYNFETGSKEAPDE